MGSVKDLNVLKNPTEGNLGVGRFVFSDRYSVFDWGEMPDQIAHKGKALCLTSAYFFEKLESMGVKTHYIGLVGQDKATSLSALTEPSNILEIKLVRVLKPTLNNGVYDYSIYRKKQGNMLIPLEVIYRNSLPEGSSVFKRLKDGSLPLKDIGLTQMPVPGQKLEKPILDVSTKLEATDRYIPWNEAQDIAGLSDAELENIKKTTSQINDLITKESNRLGLVNEDGKFEFGFDENRNLMLVDVLGTPDESRFTFQDIPVSKEAARIFYRKTAWFNETEEVKKKDRLHWKELVTSKPPFLPARLAELIALVYQSFSNEITQKKLFKTPELKDILSELKKTL